MPPRPNSPRISYLPTLVAVSMLLPRTDVKRLTMHVLAVLCGGQCPLGSSVSESPRAELGRTAETLRLRGAGAVKAAANPPHSKKVGRAQAGGRMCYLRWNRRETKDFSGVGFAESDSDSRAARRSMALVC